SSPTTPSSTLPPPPHPPLFPYTTLFRSRCQQEPLPASETQGHLHPVHFECSRRHGCEEALHGTRSQGQSRRVGQADQRGRGLRRSEEHTSELQSPDHLVCRLLLEKKKQQ